MTTDATIVPAAEPVVRRRLRRRPPPSVRNARALISSIAGYAFAALFIVVLGVVTGIPGALDALLPALVVLVPIIAALIAVVRSFRTRQWWAFGLGIVAALAVLAATAYIIVSADQLLRSSTDSAGSQADAADAVFFVQLLLVLPFILALAALWHLVRSRSWFNGEHERQLRPDETGARPITASLTEAAAATAAPRTDAEGRIQPLLSVRGLKKHFPIYGGILRRQIGTVYAVDDVDFEIMPGETFSLVGESGCGKTTLGRTVIQLTPSTAGRVVFDGYELEDVDPADMRPLRRRMQIIFQDPFGSLNPRMPVSDIIGEGLLSQGLSDRNARDKRVEDALELVGLRREYTRRYPHEFSGGQRQRIGVARALALGPDFIVADEPVSALDVSIQSQVLNLLLDLKRDLNLTYLFISHNLSVVQYFSDRIGVMYLGKIVEIGTVEELYRDPRHPYTVALLSAIPEADPRRRRKRLVLTGDVPSPAAPPSGCRFHTRCWLRERLGNPERCSTEEPALRRFGEQGHRVACHFAEDVGPTTVAAAVEESAQVVPAVAEGA